MWFVRFFSELVFDQELLDASSLPVFVRFLLFLCGGVVEVERVTVS